MKRTLTAAVVALAASSAIAQYKNDAPKKPAPSTAPKLAQAVIPAAEPLESARRISRVEAANMAKQGKAVYVDVRPKSDYDLGHIKGAINIPLAELQQRYRDLPIKKTLITYCA
jgi:3-mercaptopyruvate sulfurtransferase SseA